MDDNDAWQVATFGVAVVSNDGAHCMRMLDQIIEFVEASRPDTQLLNVERDVAEL